MAHMSYDLAVYAPAALSRKELVSLATRPRGFRSDRKAANLRVERERAYSFTVDGPFEIDPDDDEVPEPVRALDFEPRYLYSVLVEGTTESEIPWATAFAQSLAGTLNGAAIDLQTEEVWARSSLQYRANVPEAVQERIRLVEVVWICFAADVDELTVRRYLEIAGRLVPGAVPRRYGDYEPLQGSIERDGVEGFLAAWRGATSTVYFHGSSPVMFGALDAPSARGGRFWRITLDLREPLVSETWLSQLKELFGALADELPAVYAQAAVTAGHVWDGRTVAADSQTDRLAFVGGVEWEGLSPDHPWLTWLGAPFAEYYAALPADRVTRTERGVVYADAEVPTLSSELAGLQAWLPAELFAAYGPKPEEAWAVRPTIAASVVPPLLRGEGAAS